MYKNVIVTGSIAFDHIMNLSGKFRDYIMPDKLHMLNVSFVSDTMRQEMGGTGGNIAYGLGMLGMEPRLLSAAGEDFDRYKLKLVNAGVDVSLVEIFKKEMSSIGFVITDEEDNQIWNFSSNASRFTNTLKIPPKLDSDNSFVVISPSNIDGVCEFVNQCLSKKISYMYDPAFYVPSLDSDDLSKGILGAKIIIGNDYEVEMMIRRTGLSKLEILRDGRVLITTLGVDGSKIEYLGSNQNISLENRLPDPTQSADNIESIMIKPAKPAKVSDPTGAGDAYRSGFLAGYLHGFSLEVCGMMGSLSSVYTVEKYGTTSHSFSRSDFNKRFIDNFGKSLPKEFLGSDVYENDLNVDQNGQGTIYKSRGMSGFSAFEDKKTEENDSWSNSGNTKDISEDSTNGIEGDGKFKHKDEQSKMPNTLNKVHHDMDNNDDFETGEFKIGEGEGENFFANYPNQKTLQKQQAEDDFLPSEYSKDDRFRKKKNSELSKFVKTFVRQVQGKSTEDLADG